MLKFDKEKHKYYIGDKEIPSVSKIMESISCHFYTSDIPPIALELACKKGNSVHKAIYDYEVFDDHELEEQYKPIFEQYLKWKVEYKPKIIHLEIMLTDGDYAGTIDMIAEINGVTYLIDHKTSSEIHEKLVSVQESGYDGLCSHNDIKIDKHSVLHLTKKGYEFREIKLNKKMWEQCKNCYKYIKEG